MNGHRNEPHGIETEVSQRLQVAEGVVQLSLRAVSGEPLPPWAPGAHIDVFLSGLVRQYSLCGDSSDLDNLDIAVLRTPESRGGSEAVHRLQVGDRVRIGAPRNNFELVAAPEYLFVAGGIGITPILAMLRRLAHSDIPWRLVYGGRSRTSMAFGKDLEERYGGRVLIRPQDEVGLLDLTADLGPARADVAVYCCGPEPLLQAVERHCRDWPAGSLHVERFAAKTAPTAADTTSFEIELAQSGHTLTVPADRSVLDVLRGAGIDVDHSCMEGVCGTCETAVLCGEPEHRDALLSAEERAQNDVMLICVSRSRTPRLTLDL
ncbi:PDR/VanB family oxidoreductase [Mycolicibacterium neoaurum]|uniref:PDR/VanB family oxidoreductase n=1 Tax=Mycolicibacterium neoaurum TaxID=1795 RepID=UPI00248BDF86|nr:PDR/VanB family oxidoreductase [Mycolicibacterium neoaurum]WBP93679.1 PDR/VanB family oxidoreductase [Mycolicibacterium neoaurum]WBS07544.1 PDR/VanB family oxidoreductase [Mycolicibacterium neoaurum]